MTDQVLKEIVDHMSHSNLPMFEKVFFCDSSNKIKNSKYLSGKKIYS